MGSTFNSQILMDKLSKLNITQASIETLSHWCIFHMNKAREVVETWDRQFHCAPREQKLAFLYLANDIIQNSRRKGAEFVGEFWRVLPDALRNVIESGDEFGRNAAQRLVNIWDERKVFGSRGLILKQEFVGKTPESNNRNGKQPISRQKHPAGSALDKVVLDYQAISGQMDEDAILSRCRNAITSIEKVDKEIGGDFNSVQFQGSAFVEEVRGHHALLKTCIEQLAAMESARANLVSHLRESLQEQELKLDQVRNQLQGVHSQSELATNIYRRLLNSDSAQPIADQSSKEVHTSISPHSYMAGGREQSAPVMYTQQVPFTEISGHAEDDPRKSAAAAVAAKLTASTSSAQMLSYVLSSLASEAVNSNQVKESSGDYPSEKRPKFKHDQSLSYVPRSPNPSQSPTFSHSESLQFNVPATSEQYNPSEPPPPPSSSPPPLPPLPPVSQYPVPQYIPASGTAAGMQYSYSVSQQPPPMPGYPAGAPVNGNSPFVAPANSYQSFQGSDGQFYNQPSSMQITPISRQ